MAKQYEAEKIGEIHRLKRKKSNWGAIVGGVLLVVCVIALAG